MIQLPDIIMSKDETFTATHIAVYSDRNSVVSVDGMRQIRMVATELDGSVPYSFNVTCHYETGCDVLEYDT